MESFDHTAVGAGELGFAIFLYLRSSGPGEGLSLLHRQSLPFGGDHAHEVFVIYTLWYIGKGHYNGQIFLGYLQLTWFSFLVANRYIGVPQASLAP